MLIKLKATPNCTLTKNTLKVERIDLDVCPRVDEFIKLDIEYQVKKVTHSENGIELDIKIKSSRIGVRKLQ